MVEPNPVSVYNISSDDVISVDEIAEIVITTMGLSGVRLVHLGGVGSAASDIAVIRLSNDKLKSTGWRPHLTSK